MSPDARPTPDHIDPHPRTAKHAAPHRRTPGRARNLTDWFTFTHNQIKPASLAALRSWGNKYDRLAFSSPDPQVESWLMWRFVRRALMRKTLADLNLPQPPRYWLMADAPAVVLATHRQLLVETVVTPRPDLDREELARLMAEAAAELERKKVVGRRRAEQVDKRGR